MDQVERTARLIRSKGVGVYFVTQTPTDILQTTPPCQVAACQRERSSARCSHR